MRTFECMNCGRKHKYTETLRHLQEAEGKVRINCSCGYKQLIPEAKYFEKPKPKPKSDGGIQEIADGMDIMDEIAVRRKYGG